MYMYICDLLSVQDPISAICSQFGGRCWAAGVWSFADLWDPSDGSTSPDDWLALNAWMPDVRAAI